MKHQTWNVNFDLCSSEQPGLPVERLHIKKTLRKGDEAPAFDWDQESEPEDLAPTQVAQNEDLKEEGLS